MVEWFKAHAWKACDVKASAGSNPVLCAINSIIFFDRLKILYCSERIKNETDHIIFT